MSSIAPHFLVCCCYGVDYKLITNCNDDEEDEDNADNDEDADGDDLPAEES